MCCNVVQAGKSLLGLGSTLFDVGSDLLNSLNFFGYKFQSNILGNGTRSIAEFTRNSESPEIHKTWGIVGIFIMFLPGMILSIGHFSKIKEFKETPQKDYCVGSIAGLLTMVLIGGIYPIILVGMQIWMILCSVFGTVDDKIISEMMALIACEAFFECTCQMALQGFTIIYGYNANPIQIN